MVQRQKTEIPGVELYTLPTIRDARGALSVLEAAASLPFPVRRLFTVYAVPQEQVRGRHAHRRQNQFLVCVSGSCRVSADNGRARQDFHLDSPGTGLHLPALVWSEQWDFSPDAVLLVLASDAYDPTDYVNDYEEFQRLTGADQ